MLGGKEVGYVRRTGDGKMLVMKNHDNDNDDEDENDDEKMEEKRVRSCCRSKFLPPHK